MISSMLELTVAEFVQRNGSSFVLQILYILMVFSLHVVLAYVIA